MDAAVSIGVTKASFSTTSRNEIMNHVTAMGACLERADVRQAGGATSQADVTLSIALAKRTGTTTFTIDYNQERNNCSAALFLSKRKDLAELDRNSSEFQSNVQQVNFSSDGLSDQFRSKLRRRARGALYAFVELACGESHLRSSVVRQKGYKGIESKNSSVLSMTQYLARITARMRRLA
mgnify:CR=1 FL=1